MTYKLILIGQFKLAYISENFCNLFH